MSVRVSCVLCTEVVLVLLQICCVVCIEAEGDGGPAASEFLWSETDGSGRRGGGKEGSRRTMMMMMMMVMMMRIMMMMKVNRARGEL